MFINVVATVLLATQAAAFTAVPRVTTSSGVMSMKVDGLVGSSAPLGFFDPLGFTKGADAKTISKYRESELKHGRVAMLAVLGWLTAEKWHPLYGGKLSSNPLEAFGQVPPLAFVQIIAFCGLLEYAFSEGDFIMYSEIDECESTARGEGYKAGDYYGISTRFQNAEDPAWTGFQTRELNNGRLAMFAIMGEIAHSFITGKGALEQLGF